MNGKLKVVVNSIELKILICFLIVTVLSVSIVTWETYSNSSKTIEKNAIEYVYDGIDHSNNQMESMIEEVEMLCAVIATNKDNVIDVINDDSKQFSYEWYQQQKKGQNFISSVISFRQYITKVSVIGLNERIVQVGQGTVINSIINEPWVKPVLETTGTHMIVNTNYDRSITIAQSIYDGNKVVGIVIINISKDIMKTIYSIKTMSGSSIFILNKEGEYLYNSDVNIKQNNIQDTDFKDLFLNVNYKEKGLVYKIDDKDYLVMKLVSDKMGLISIGIIPYDLLMHDAIIIKNHMIKIVFIVAILVLIVSSILSKQITKNIKKLRIAMALVIKGDLGAKPQITTRDEIGQLSNCFVSMMTQMQKLMEDIKIRERQKRELELQALQAQVSPHFIYNTLNTIRYLSVMQNVKNIEEVTGALIELLRSVLGNTQKMITISEELNYAKSYVLIQKYKYINNLTIKFDIDEDILKFKTLKLILQPIIENALIHGILSTDNGIITIKGYRNEDVVFFEVTDNGKGISKETISEIMEENPADKRDGFSGIGIKNVDERLKIVFGNPFGLEIFSEPDVYTTIKITFPITE